MEGTLPSTSTVVENNKGEDDSNKEDATSKVEEVKGYDEVFYDEPNWEVEYEGEDESYIEEKKQEYKAMKWVFEDMTQNFKHKKEVTALEPIDVMSNKDKKSTSFVCDIDNVMFGEEFVDLTGRKFVWEKDLYPEFTGFSAKKTDATSWSNEEAIRVDLKSSYYDAIYMTIYVIPNEDGTYTYKSISVHSNLHKPCE